jgi:two-component system, NarL family, nitrate/nitrite response regulator NarL
MSMMKGQIRIGVVDDHPLLREGVVSTLRAAAMNVVGVGASASDAVRLADEQMPDVMLLDISMPGGGVDAARAIAQSHPKIKTIMLTVSEREEDVIAAMEAGARAYVLKGIGAPELLATIRAIHQGETYITPQIAARVLSKMQRRTAPDCPPRVKAVESELTIREEQIMDQVAQGLTNKEIALKFSLSEKTVKHYMTSVLQKLQVRNRVQAVIAMQKQGQRVS